MTLPVFLLEDRRTIHNLIYTVITTVKGSKEPLSWIKVNPLDLFIGLCADLLMGCVDLFMNCFTTVDYLFFSLFVWFFDWEQNWLSYSAQLV